MCLNVSWVRSKPDRIIDRIQSKTRYTKVRNCPAVINKHNPSSDKMDDKADTGTRKKVFGLTIGLIVTGLVAVVLLGVLIWAVNSKVGESM